MVKTVVEVVGMSCGMCESHINDAVRNAFKVRKVTSSRAKQKTEILSDAPLDEAALQSVINGLGYRALSVHSEPYEKKGLFFFQK